MPFAPGDPSEWVHGSLDMRNPSLRSNWDVELDIKRSVLWPYCGKSAGIWKFPADRSTGRAGSGPYAGQTVPRVRNISMNGWFNSTDVKGSPRLHFGCTS